jgi:hypothetical protein
MARQVGTANVSAASCVGRLAPRAMMVFARERANRMTRPSDATLVSGFPRAGPTCVAIT